MSEVRKRDKKYINTIAFPFYNIKTETVNQWVSGFSRLWATFCLQSCVKKIMGPIFWALFLKIWLLVGLHDILHAIVMHYYFALFALRIADESHAIVNVILHSLSAIYGSVLNAASSESRWWRFTVNHRSVFEMRMTIAYNISCSPRCLQGKPDKQLRFFTFMVNICFSNIVLTISARR